MRVNRICRRIYRLGMGAMVLAVTAETGSGRCTGAPSTTPLGLGKDGERKPPPSIFGECIPISDKGNDLSMTTSLKHRRLSSAPSTFYLNRWRKKLHLQFWEGLVLEKGNSWGGGVQSCAQLFLVELPPIITHAQNWCGMPRQRDSGF